jgi:hypothetical protein
LQGQTGQPGCDVASAIGMAPRTDSFAVPTRPIRLIERRTTPAGLAFNR